MKRTTLVGFAAFTITACGPTLASSAYPTGAAHPARSEQPVMVLEGAELPVGLQEIAIIEANCIGDCQMPMVMEELAKQGALLGATHVVRIRVNQGSSMLTAHGVATYGEP